MPLIRMPAYSNAAIRSPGSAAWCCLRALPQLRGLTLLDVLARRPLAEALQELPLRG